MSDATDETIATMLSASLTGNINGYARVRGPLAFPRLGAAAKKAR